jgi:hypothetical protein
MSQESTEERPVERRSEHQTTQHPSDLDPVRVLLLSDEETPTAALIENRIRNVRRLYAIGFILRVPEITGTELVPMVALLLSAEEDADLDGIIPLPLRIRAAGTGTFWIDFFLQLPAHLPTAADLHQWTEWLKNAHAALVEVAAICSIIGGWLRRHAGSGIPAVSQEPDTPVSQILKRVDELKGATDDQKEQFRRAILRDLRTFEPTALQHSVEAPGPIRVKPARE